MKIAKCYLKRGWRKHTFGIEMIDGINAKLEIHCVAMKDEKEKI